MNETKKIIEQISAIHMQCMELWRQKMFLTWRWWVLLAMLILPWVLWAMVRKKDSSNRLLFAGITVAFLSFAFDMIGIILDIWSYPILLFPLLPESSAYNLSMLPVVTMLFLQFFQKIKPVYKALIYATAGSFIFQPIMEWMGLYANDEWKDFYSFPILFGMYLLANYLATRRKFEMLS